MYDIYQIMPGDTLSSIAKKYNITESVLEDLNKGSNFLPGTNIIIPTINRYFNVYRIKEGDTLISIAKKYNTDYNLLAQINGLNVSDYIYPNMDILVPKESINYYMTKEGDTLVGVARGLNANLGKLLRDNKNIYLKDGQLIVYSSN